MLLAAGAALPCPVAADAPAGLPAAVTPTPADDPAAGDRGRHEGLEGPGFLYPVGDDEPEPAGKMRTDAVTVNLAPAVCGLLVLQWEHRFFERFSAVLVGGAGIGSSLSTFADMTVLEVGAQIRGYALATGHQAAGIAVEFMAGWLPSDPHRERRGQAISPRLVYRIMSDGGLTAELQLGMAWTQRSAVQVGTGVRVTGSSGPAPIQAFAVGYSF